MPSSMVLSGSQQLAVESLIGSGAFRTQSEIYRSAVDDFIHHIPKTKLLAAAVWAYSQGKATLSQAAALADIPHEEMQRVLVREGIFKAGLPRADIEADADFLSKNAVQKSVSRRKK